EPRGNAARAEHWSGTSMGWRVAATPTLLPESGGDVVLGALPVARDRLIRVRRASVHDRSGARRHPSDLADPFRALARELRCPTRAFPRAARRAAHTVGVDEVRRASFA